jgi:hypothetical protein
VNRRCALAAPLLMASSAASAAAAFTNTEVVLLQPEEVLRQRVADAKALASYIRDIDRAANTALESVFQKKPTGGFVAVALKPPRRARIWLDLDPPLPQSTQAALRSAVLSVQAPEVSTGVVVFALKATFWGGRLPTRAAPAPEEWKAEAARLGVKLEVGELVERLWPD